MQPFNQGYYVIELFYEILVSKLSYMILACFEMLERTMIIDLSEMSSEKKNSEFHRL